MKLQRGEVVLDFDTAPAGVGHGKMACGSDRCLHHMGDKHAQRTGVCHYEQMLVGVRCTELLPARLDALL